MLLSRQIKDNGPGVLLAGVVTVAALGFQQIEVRYAGFAWLDALVVAILLGTLIHTTLGLDARFRAGVRFASKTLLEVAIVLLGASVSFATVAQAGFGVLGAVVVVVVASLIVSYGIARALGLSDRLAMLVACGNSICGNSAIVAAGPVIGAQADDVAASISFTAALGILVVLLLPMGAVLLGLTQWQYGLVAGMTVYAVPQVLAVTVPMGAVSAQVGTLVKLMRVAMLGPVILVLGLWCGRRAGARPRVMALVPWFILGFLGMMAARSAGLIPEASLAPLGHVSATLTIVSMAALGLSVDMRSVMAAGGRVLAAGALSILMLTGLALAALAWMPAA